MISRSFCFTLNNFTEEEQWNIEQTQCRYITYGIETGTNGTIHLQGYIELHSPKRMSSLKKCPGWSRCHIESRRGTREQARAYCQKDGEWEEFGDWEAGGQGKRNDLKELMNAIKNKTPKLEIYEQMPITAARNLNFMKEYTATLEKNETKEFRHVEVIALIGDAGTGKTKKVHDENPNVFTVNCDETFPFDGYDGEEVILLDDFYGDMKYHQILRVLDGHQFRVNIKGGHRYARWTKVYITSNKMPEQWYKCGLTPALKRRINSVTEFRNEETGNTEPSLVI